MNRRLALLGLLSASACAPMTQHALIPTAAFAGPRLEPDALVSFDGARLAMNTWLAEGEPWAVIVALHGMNDYAQAFTLAAPVWAEAGITTYAYDQRGFGRTAGRGVWAGEGLMVQDLRTCCALVRARHPKAILVVAGESMGGAVAIAAFASTNPPDADRLCLIAPAVWGWDEQPIMNRLSLWLGAHVSPASVLTPPAWLVRQIRACDNVEILREISRDRNMIFSTRIDTVYGLVSLMQHGRDGVARLRLPTLYQYGAHDQVIPEPAARHAVLHASPAVRTAYYPKGYHMLTRDLAGDEVSRDVIAFIRDPKAALPSGAEPFPLRDTAGVAAVAARG